MRSLALFFLVLLAPAALAKVPVVLSTDVGNEIDDQWAVAYLLTSPDFETIGILSANAPTLPAPSARYTYKVLRDEVEHRLNMQVHPPLIEGGSLPLTALTKAQPSAAVDFLISASKLYSSTIRLNVLVIGAATDVASAILVDPSITSRINVVAMGFKNLSADGGREYNVENDPLAWRVILNSSVPVTIGSGDVCRQYLALNFTQAATLLSGHGPVTDWLWSEYETYYYGKVKPLRVNDFSKSWIIWDIITLAHLRGLTTAKNVKRLTLSPDLALSEGSSGQTTWIESVNAAQLWREFIANLDAYRSTHALAPASTDGR